MDKDCTLTPKQEAFVEAETGFLVKELAYYHKGPVKITLKGGNHIAYTYGTVDEPHTAQIVMNPSILAPIRNSDRARLIWRGIGYHELLHHIFPAEAEYKQAIEEGFKSLFNLVDDEQNERRGRSMHAEWGRCFQSVCSFIFEKHRCKQGTKIIVGPTQEMQEEEETKGGKQQATGQQEDKSQESQNQVDPDRVDESRTDENQNHGDEDRAKASPEVIYNKRFLEFAYHFRRHLPGVTDPAVKTALSLVPENFKELSKPDLLNLTRHIHHALCEGFSPEIFAPPSPSPPLQTTPAEDNDSETESTEADSETENSKQGQSGPSVKSFWQWLKHICTSKWSLLTLLLCTVGWSAFFLQQGTSLWLEIVINAIIITGSLGLGLVCVRTLQWLHRQWLLKRLQQQKYAIRLQPSQLPGTGLAARIKTRLKKLQRRGRQLINIWFYYLVSLPLIKLLYGWLEQLRSFLVKSIKRAVALGKYFWRISKLAMIRLWKKQAFRIFLAAIPVAFLITIVYTVLTHLQELPWWLVLLALLAFLLLGPLVWRYRKGIYNFLMPPNASFDLNIESIRCFEPEIDKEILDFHQIHNVVPVEADEEIISTLLPEVQPLAQVLRPHFAKCGSRYVDKEFQPDGFDLVEELEYALLGETNLFVEDSLTPRASVHIELALDCSSSMSSSTSSLGRGEKFRLGQLFAALIEETTVGQYGISARFWGFTDNTIYDCGVPGQRLISGLKPNGGNNDAAMLYHMANSALQSNKDIKILLMVSDGQPSECTWGTVQNRGRRVRSDGGSLVQIAVDTISEPAFEEFSVSLVGQSMPEAINSMACVLARIIEANS